MTNDVSNTNTIADKEVKPGFLAKYSMVMFLGLVTIAGYFIWQAWPTIIVNSMQWQKQINNDLSELLYAAKNESLMAGISLIALSFLYGMLHSIGPGHGKLIVTTYIATQDAKVKISLILTLLSSLLQALVAVALVSALLILFNASMREINSQAELLIPLSFYTVIVLGLVIVWRNLVLMWRAVRRHKAEANNDSCGCGHQHVVASEQINDASSFKEYLVIIFSIGIRPCTGAIMVLLFANMLDIYWLGVVSAIVMALGTALTTSMIAIMTITGKQAVRRYLATGKRHQHPKNGPNMTQFIVPIMGGLLLILLGMLLLESRPVGMSPLF